MSERSDLHYYTDAQLLAEISSRRRCMVVISIDAEKMEKESTLKVNWWCTHSPIVAFGLSRCLEGQLVDHDPEYDLWTRLVNDSPSPTSNDWTLNCLTSGPGDDPGLGCQKLTKKKHPKLNAGSR